MALLVTLLEYILYCLYIYIQQCIDEGLYYNLISWPDKMYYDSAHITFCELDYTLTFTDDNV